MHLAYSAISLGVLVWGAYATAEVAFLVVRPLAVGHEQMLLPVHWRFLGLAFAAYLGTGAALGALAGWVGRRAGLDRAATARLAALTLVGAYLVNLAVEAARWNAGSTTALALGLIALTATLGGLVFPRLERLSRPWSDPWTLAILLVAGPLAAPRFRPAAVVGVLALSVGALAVSRLLLDRGRTLGVNGASLRQLGALAVAATAVCAAIPAVEQKSAWVRRFEPGTAAGSRPNIVLIVLDTVRADHMSVYGYGRKTTPGLERFAARATLYRYAFAASNFTLPSHASIFTGLDPRTHGATNLLPGLSYGESLDARFETLAERLAAHGYLNLAVSANFGYLQPDFGLHQGFHFYDARQPSVCLPEQRRHTLRFGLRRLLGLVTATDALEQRFRRASEINEAVSGLLDQARDTRAPFFLFINYMDAHDPYLPPPPFNTLFEGRTPGFRPEHWEAAHERIVRGAPGISNAEQTHFSSQYDGAIAYLDSEVELLIKEFQKRGLFENTMIVVTSDHGEALGEHGYLGHGWSLHNHQVRVPLIIKYPGQREGRVSEQNASHVDLMPTILDVVGIEFPPDLHGASLRRMEEEARSRPVYSEAYLGADKIHDPRRQRAIVSWAIVSAERTKLISISDGRLEFYDLNNDPSERQNLAAHQPQQSAELLRALEGWKERHPLVRARERPRNRFTLERLRALGYVR